MKLFAVVLVVLLFLGCDGKSIQKRDVDGSEIKEAAEEFEEDMMKNSRGFLAKSISLVQEFVTSIFNELSGAISPTHHPHHHTTWRPWYTTRNPWNPWRTTRNPWRPWGTTKRPWWRSTDRPWWRTSERPWWQTTESPWRQTTESPWWHTTESPWWETTEKQ